MNVSILIDWTSPFSYLGVPGVLFILFLIQIPVSMSQKWNAICMWVNVFKSTSHVVFVAESLIKIYLTFYGRYIFALVLDLKI